MNKGGDGGKVFIVARKIQGSGKITADGGKGSVGGRGGEVHLVSEDMGEFDGEISAKGGDAVISEELLNELREAISKKNKSLIIKVLTYIGDKSVDALIALLAKGY